MTGDDVGTPARKRGRPRGHANQQVVQSLLDATELLLKDYSHHDLTERMIAASANVHVRTIHYYFDSKDELLFAVISRNRDEISQKLKLLETLDSSAPDVTRRLFGSLVAAYHAKPWISKIGASELARSHSTIKDLFMRRYVGHGLGVEHIEGVIRRLMDCGVYDRRVNAHYVAQSMISIIAARFLLPPDTALELDEVERQEWIDHIADMFDRTLRPVEESRPFPLPMDKAVEARVPMRFHP